MTEFLLRSLHLISVLALGAGTLLAILALGSRDEDTDHAALGRALRQIYAGIACAALVAATTGLGLWLYAGRPAEFYNNNPVFHAKLGLFVILLSLLAYPAHVFLRRRANTAMPSDGVERLQKAALPLLLIIPVLAYLMARGVGY